MLETRAIVIKLEGNEALVESRQGGGCGRCDSENGCGSGKLSQLLGTHTRQFRVRNDANAAIGTEVQITLAEGVLLRSALLMYVLPLFLLVAGAAAAGQLGADDASAERYSIAGGALGLLLGFVLAKWMARRQRGVSVAQPVIASCAHSASGCAASEH
jgi:sigma-E factor negative regulatory protein RseC